MSSHHIIREAQEPALIIANGEICSEELLNQLLEWSPFIVVLDGALDRVLELGIKFDVVLGDFDKTTTEEVLKRVPPDTEVLHIQNQNSTDLEKGIEYLIERKHKAANIIWATGRRSDHSINNIATLVRYADKIQLTLLDTYSKIYQIHSGFKKHYQAGSNVSLIPLNKVEHLKTENLQWNLNDETLEFPYQTSSSNKIKDTGILSVTFTKGVLLMMECMD
jgi:thiamine pyrophosphokinase